jgi:hypothetical protein
VRRARLVSTMSSSGLPWSNEPRTGKCLQCGTTSLGWCMRRVIGTLTLWESGHMRENWKLRGERNCSTASPLRVTSPQQQSYP